MASLASAWPRQMLWWRQTRLSGASAITMVHASSDRGVWQQTLQTGTEPVTHCTAELANCSHLSRN